MQINYSMLRNRISTELKRCLKVQERKSRKRLFVFLMLLFASILSPFVIYFIYSNDHLPRTFIPSPLLRFSLFTYNSSPLLLPILYRFLSFFILSYQYWVIKNLLTVADFFKILNLFPQGSGGAGVKRICWEPQRCTGNQEYVPHAIDPSSLPSFWT